MPRRRPTLALALLLAAAGCASSGTAGAPRLARAAFGATPAGEPVERFTLRNAHGVEVEVVTLGAIITRVRVPDRDGRFADVVLGFDSVAPYLDRSPYFGAVVGRYANRIANGRFTLDGATYQLAINNAPNTLHGGTRGFDKVVWSVVPPAGAGPAAQVRLRHVSPDGEEHFPGTLTATVTYTLTDRNELAIDYEATTTRATPVNLSQHTYWNLAGEGSPTVLDHRLTIRASRFTPVDSTLIPTGELRPVDGTPFDFRAPTAIGLRIGQADEQLRVGRGYDHNWVVDAAPASDGPRPVARLEDPASGRTLDIASTEPGLQFYSGNFLDGRVVGKHGHAYAYRSAVALETQHFPDSPNHPTFPTTILRPGETYRSRTVFTFGVAR